MNALVRELHCTRPSPPPRGNDASLSLSRRWFDLDWSGHLPWQIDEVSVTVGDFATAMAFMQTAQQELLPQRPGDRRFLADPMSPNKSRFYEEADVFAFAVGGEYAGFLVGHPIDWSSYYIRMVALLPKFRGRGIVAEVSAKMFGVLASVGVERVEGDIPPANTANMVTQTRLGYVATGLNNTDRWGSMVRLTRYLRPASHKIFREQYNVGIWPQCRPPPI